MHTIYDKTIRRSLPLTVYGSEHGSVLIASAAAGHRTLRHSSFPRSMMTSSGPEGPGGREPHRAARYPRMQRYSVHSSPSTSLISSRTDSVVLHLRHYRHDYTLKLLVLDMRL